MVLKALTNEKISEEFGERYDHFTLTHFLIEIAQLLIKKGEEVTPWILLEELKKNPNRYDLNELSKEEVAESEPS
ncbi:MAG: hypothetical protein SNF33_06785 [Candidatus Algichlamydia australiensis]|nr:hypothetical protein [Chlamydiales bacterium]